ncbi:MAG: hypothetical protein H3C39_01040 [Flavobacteriia bacterium]|nr:hypothetical protein [Flavobacteriia bacterium]
MSSKVKDTQLSQIKKVINKVVAKGPDFLDNKITADEMAHSMVNAVQDFAKEEQKEGGIRAENEEAQELIGVLQEILGCGSGFLAQQCDSDCVARTITYVVNKFKEDR